MTVDHVALQGGLHGGRRRSESGAGRIGHDGARLSGSRVTVGIQSKGTAIIQRNFAPSFALSGAHKDAGLVLELAADKAERDRVRRERARVGRIALPEAAPVPSNGQVSVWIGTSDDQVVGQPSSRSTRQAWVPE